VLRIGRSGHELNRLIRETGATCVYWSRRYSPKEVAADTVLKQQLEADGVRVSSQIPDMDGASLLAAPKTLTRPPDLASEDLSDLELLPKTPDWAARFGTYWHPGEQGAQANLNRFIAERARGYAQGRDFPALNKVSRLSPHLQMGEISPRQVMSAIVRASFTGDLSEQDAQKFKAELGWREFSAHLLFHNPDLVDVEFQPKFRAFPWHRDDGLLHAWQKGQTGYPIIDAGMRELWATGYMHNRVRMVVASFLVKHLRQDWRLGRDWFWDTLVDADVASNTASWQWVAGCGADAAPYFRVFNPMIQASKFDPEGHYIRQWVPEIAKLPNKHLAAPWLASEKDLKTAHVTLGESYPNPIVDHASARIAALAAFETLS